MTEPDPARARREAEELARTARFLTNEVLDISRIEAKRLQLSLEPVSVRETLRQAIDLVGPSAIGLRVSVRVT